MSDLPVPPSDQAAASPAPPPPRSLRYKLTVAYDGAAFHGWQKQRTADGSWLRTVQGVLEEAVMIALQQPIRLVGASRTDAGVHALGQVAQFDAATRIPLENLASAINARLPEDIEVRAAEVAHPKFDAITGARSKQYRYRIFNAPQRPLHRRKYVGHCWWTLDLERMRPAAALLAGEHDFTAFAGSGSPRLSNVRTVHHCRVEAVPAEQEIHVVIAANGFLYNMVRIVTGTLVEVGRGAIPPEQVARALAEKDRRLAGPTVGPEGLWLEWIAYD